VSISKLAQSSLAIGAVLTTALPASAFSPTNKARILYVGDSLAANTLNAVTFWTQATGKAELSYSFPPRLSIWGGMALCDFLDGKAEVVPHPVEKLKPMVMTVRPHLVIMQFWGNAWGSPCMAGAQTDQAYYDAYFWDSLNASQQIAEAATQAGIPRPKILWVLQGPDRGSQNRTRLLNDIYSYAAWVHGDRTTDAGSTVSGPNDRYEWVQYSPCTNWEYMAGICTHPQIVAQLHKNGDGVHFCLGGDYFFFGCDTLSPAIERYGLRIAADANAWLGI
jgi:hypothetical protein